MRNSSARPDAVKPLGELDRVDERRGDPVAPADHAEANTFRSANVRVVAQKIFQQPEERMNFILGRAQLSEENA